MKTNVTLPEIPQGLDPKLERYCTDILQVIKDFRLETANAMSPHIKYIAADYTIKANDYYTEYQVDNSLADVDITFPPLAQISFRVTALDDAYDVNCIPDGSDTINGTSSVTINQTNGWWDFSGGETEWKGATNGYSTIYRVESESADNGLTVDGTYDDVTGMVLLNGIYGTGFLDAFAVQKVEDGGAELINGIWGIGKTSGNNAPDIKTNYRNGYRLITAEAQIYYTERQICNFPYESDGSIIYMKAAVDTNALPADDHIMFGATDCPMYIQWRRIT